VRLPQVSPGNRIFQEPFAMSLRLMRVVVVIVVGGWVAHSQAPQARSDEPILLKYKLAKGDKAIYRQGFDMKQAQSIMGMKLDNTIKAETIVIRAVDSVDADGRATVKLKTDRRKMSSDFTGAGKYEFDSKSSERDTSSTIGSAVTPLFERLTGSEYELVLTPQGHVAEVKGYAELVGDLLKDNPLASQFGAADNKSAAHQEQRGFITLSEKPVKPGDQWEAPIDVELTKLGKIKGTITYTYEGPDKVGDRKTARIGVVSNIALDLNIDQGTSKVTGTLSTTSSSGTVQFDPEAGRVISSKQTSALSGQLSVEVGGMTIPIDNQQEDTETLELLDKLPE
jgi:hypothetical protein